MTDMTPHAYIEATLKAITASNLLTGLMKAPFLALAMD